MMFISISSIHIIPLQYHNTLLHNGMSHAATASPNPPFRAPWRVGSIMVGRGNAGWMTSKSGHLHPCRNCSQGPPAEKTGRGSLLNHPPCPPDDPVNQGMELNIAALHSVTPLLPPHCATHSYVNVPFRDPSLLSFEGVPSPSSGCFGGIFTPLH